MKIFKMLLLVSILFLVTLPVAAARDFDWLKDFNIRAEADPTGFKARIRTRFKIGDVEIDAVLSNVETPADAYIIFRLREMSKRSTRYVVEKYNTGKGKGWGNLAKSLGIKPGSREFHALKRGHDLYNDDHKGKGKSKSQKMAKGKSKK